VLAAQPAARAEEIAVAAAVDRGRYRRADPVRLRIELQNSGRARPLDVYAVVRGAGDLVFLDGRRTLRSESGRWMPWGRGLPLPSHVTTLLAVPPGELRPGPYTAYAIVTEPGTHTVVAAASAQLSVGE
jgi:hypothetical protein